MKTEIIKIRDENDSQAIKKAVCMLEEGKLVAFPTETVYGIGCKASLKAIQRLDEVKGRHPDKRYTLHIGNFNQLQSYVPRMSLRAGKLVYHALPGPLTVVFELDDGVLGRIKEKLGKEVVQLLYPDSTIGIRYPDHPVASAVLSEAQCPVVAPSANPADKDPATTFEEVIAYFDGILDGVVQSPALDGGYQKSSTVVKIGKTNIQVLRWGTVSADRIRELTTIRILFVCTGNTCRSPMAKGICRKQFCNILGCSIDELADFGYIVESAGVAAMTGMPASAYAVEVCEQNGISLREHKSVSLSPQQIDDSDRLFVMGRGHLKSILEFYPQAAQKCFLLGNNGDIADPVGQGLDVYQRCFKQIEKAIEQRMSEIL